MKRITLAAVAVGLVITGAVNSRASVDFGSLPGSEIQFGPGSQFSITDSIFGDAALGGAAQFQITSAGAASGLFGAFSGGPWTFGAISSSLDGTQTADVLTTGGGFAIDDGSGHLLTGNVNWVQVYTLGATGGLNSGATINITGMTYTGGSNPALLALLSAAGTGAMDLSFQFASPESLTQLADGATIGTSYSGSLTPLAAVPEPATIIAGLLLLLPLGMSAFRIFRKNRPVYS